MKYTCNDIFMIRTPSLPVNTFSEFMNFEGHGIEDFIQEHDLGNFMDQSILVSSRELYKAKKRNAQSNKKSKAKEISVIKYFTRSATRPTPYGLFAGVALGEFCKGQNTDRMIVDEKRATIECRIDHSWLSHFVYELENDPVVYTQLRLRFNHNCYVSGDRLKNPHYSNHGFASPNSTTVSRNHIRNTPLIAFIRQEAQGFIAYNALKEKIQDSRRKDRINHQYADGQRDIIIQFKGSVQLCRWVGVCFENFGADRGTRCQKASAKKS